MFSYIPDKTRKNAMHRAYATVYINIIYLQLPPQISASFNIFAHVHQCPISLPLSRNRGCLNERLKTLTEKLEH
jgi:hypothetical protein